MAFDSAAQGQVQEFLTILRRRRWQVILPALFVLAIGVLFAVIVPKKYEATTRVEIRESRVEEQLSSSPQSAGPVREIYNAEQHIRHYQRVKDIIDEQGKLWDVYVKLNPRERHEYIRTILGNIDVAVVAKAKETGSTFVDIIYADVDPNRAERFLEELTRRWVEEVVDRERSVAAGERDVLQNQANAAERRFRELYDQYINVARDMGIDPTQPLDPKTQRESDPFIVALGNIESERAELDVEIAQFQGEIDELQQGVDEEPPMKTVVSAKEGLQVDDRVAEIEFLIQELEQERRRYTPLHSAHQRIGAQIKDLQDQIDEVLVFETDDTSTLVERENTTREEMIASLAGKRSELAGLRSRQAALQRRYADAAAEVSKRYDDYRDLTSLYEERELARKDYDAKSLRLSNKQADLQIMTEAWDRPFEVVESPRASNEPTEPNPWLIVAFTALAGVALGLILSLGSEYGRNCYRTVHELSQVMTVPVLGVVNAIATRAELRRNQARRLIVGLSSAIILGSIGLFTWIYAFSPDKLPVSVLQVVEDIQLRLM